MRKTSSIRMPALVWALAWATTAGAAAPLPHRRADGGSSAACAWPFIVTAHTLNIAYPDPNATYWATPIALADGERLTLRGTYPSARFMAVTLYDVAGNLVGQLSDFEIPPDAGSANPYAEAAPPPGSGRSWTLRVVPAASGESGAGVMALPAGDGAGWIVYRVYLGNPPGDPSGGAALPSVELERGAEVVRALEPCTRFLPGTAIAAALASKMPAPVVVTQAPEMVRIAHDGGLFVNAANAYLSGFAARARGRILVLRGALPSFPDTGAGESVVGPFAVRYASITTNADAKPYPVIDGVYDAQLPLDAAGYYTVVVAHDGEVPRRATAADGVVALRWGSTAAETVIVRNMLPAASFTSAVQDVTPSPYGAPSDAAEVMGAFYPVVVECTAAEFDAAGARGCFAAAGVPFPGD